MKAVFDENAPCIFCGSTTEITIDHVPPKGIFPKPRPSNLITVPSCKACNKSSEEDDEYFKTRLGLNDQARGHSSIPAQTESIFRGLNRAEARGFARQLLADTFPVPLFTKSGLFVGEGRAFHVDMDRIRKVLERTVRGLYYAESGQRLPDGHGVTVISNEMLIEQGKQAMDEVKEWFLIPLMQIEPKVIGPDTFSYRYSILPNLSSVWLLAFYARVFFLALTSDGKNANQGQ